MNDTRDIVERLRFPAPYATKITIMRDAAAEIENLREELEGYHAQDPAGVLGNVTPIGGPK